jgi:hypothetical protein
MGYTRASTDHQESDLAIHLRFQTEQYHTHKQHPEFNKLCRFHHRITVQLVSSQATNYSIKVPEQYKLRFGAPSQNADSA